MGTTKALEIIQTRPALREILHENTRHFRDQMNELGFNIIAGDHPIVPIMIGDEKKNVALANAVNAQGVFVVAFSFPVVPRGEARIRVQMSAAHSRDQLDYAISVFKQAGEEQGII